MSFRSAAALLAAIALPENLPAEVNFEKQLLPALTEKCLDCHNAPYEDNGRKKEPKAGLRMDAAWAMLQGSENGPVLKPGESAKSYLYEVVTLPEDDDMFMPPKGDPMTKKEIALLKKWIDEGADFGGWEGNLEGKPDEPKEPMVKEPKVREHNEFYETLAAGLEPATEEARTKAEEAGAQLAELQVNVPLLRVDFLTGVSDCNDEKVAALAPLKDHIARLDLGRTGITDASMTGIGKMSRLANLDLRQTAITDKGLGQLKGLKNLRTLNLYGTEVTDAGLKQLAAMKNLKTVYLWQTKATPAGVKSLKAAIPGLEASVK
jgi:hypothetical protein